MWLYHFGSGIEDGQEEKGLAHACDHLIFKGTKKSKMYECRKIQQEFPLLKISSENEMISRDDLENLFEKHESYDTIHSLARIGGLYLSEGDIDSIGRKYGATLNAYTSLQKTSYFFEVGADNILPFLQILSNSAQNANFQDDHINSEIKAILQEMKMGNDNNIRMAIQKSMEMQYGVN